MRTRKRIITWRSLSLVLLPALALLALVFTGKPKAAPAIVTITEFSDYQCPYCKQAATIVSQVRQTYGERAKFVFKQMPLPMHRQAFKAAQASVCAGEQGKFWEYHDRLFAARDLSVDALNRIAAEVRLNQNEFSQCLSSDASSAAVERDMAEADRLGVSGTPTFFINGKAVKGAATFATLKQEIDGAMTKVNHSALGSSNQTEDPLEMQNVGADLRVRSPRVSAESGLGSKVSPASLTDSGLEGRQQDSTITITSGVTLSPATIDFGYQLVGTTSAQIVETVTNSGTAPLVIANVSLSGRDRRDFNPTYNFGLPVTVAPGNSIDINLSFTPALPWRAGTRNARLGIIAEKRNSRYVPLTGIGATCGGPLPVCSSGCADADGDGLNDAWELAGGIDLNNDGVVDATNDLLLPGADPFKQDVYVQYDWMDYGNAGNACNTDSDCTGISSGHAGEVCTGPQVLPTQTGSCVYACSTDTDCAARGPSHALDKCMANACVHTHDPEVLAPGALQAVVDSFTAHGINLHIIRGHALPHSLVVSYRLDNQMTDSCEGASQPDVGVGKYAVSLYDLKAQSSLDPLKIAYHYGLFGHYSACDNALHCSQCPTARNPDGSPKNTPAPGQSGLAEVSGNDFVVSLGTRFSDLRHVAGVFDVGSTFMHELGHNLGLRHGGGIDTPCQTPGAACPITGVCTVTPVGNYCLQGDEINAKPNYLSVMNYRYQFTGIRLASAVGSSSPMVCVTNQDCPAGALCNGGSCARLDYSNQVLPTGGNTPGSLDQSSVPNSPAVGDPGLGLSEPEGLGSGVADLFTFTDAHERGIPRTAASDGPVDWDGDGLFISTNVQADTNCGPPGFADHLCTQLQYPQLKGHTDWGPAGQNQFTYKFQCTPFGGPMGDGAGAALWMLAQNEPGAQTAMDDHLLYPRSAKVTIESEGTTRTVCLDPVPQGQIRIVLPGTKDFDVCEIEQSSISLYGAKPLGIFQADVDGDGLLDLVIVFDKTATRLAVGADRDVMNGWLKNGQIFFGEDLMGTATTSRSAGR